MSDALSEFVRKAKVDPALLATAQAQVHPPESLQAFAAELIAMRGGTCEAECDHEIYEKGRCVVVLAGPRANVIDRFVREVARRSGQKLDWHFMGGRARVLLIFENPSLPPYQKAALEIHRLLPALRWATCVHNEGSPVGCDWLQVSWAET